MTPLSQDPPKRRRVPISLLILDVVNLLAARQGGERVTVSAPEPLPTIRIEPTHPRDDDERGVIPPRLLRRAKRKR